MSTRTRAAALAAAALLLAGCGNFADAAAGPSADRSTAATSTPSATPSATPMDTGDSEPPLPTTETPGAWPALDVAVAAMTAYINHGVDPDGWFAGLTRWLSPEARAAYVRTDNALIPARLLIGTPSVTTQTNYLATVLVPTDAGTYQVLLSRKADSSWQVERFTPPA